MHACHVTSPLWQVSTALKLLLHEAFHVLGFTADKISQFPCPDYPGYDRYGGADPSYGTAALLDCPSSLSRNPVESVATSSGTVQMLRSPKVLEAARRHYNCSETSAQANDALGSCGDGDGDDAGGGCIDGMPFEDAGGEGTQNSHWERRVMYSEVMIT